MIKRWSSVSPIQRKFGFFICTWFLEGAEFFTYLIKNLNSLFAYELNTKVTIVKNSGYYHVVILCAA